MKPHKCPVCNGTGLVSTPPGQPGDTGYILTTSDTPPGPYTCPACHGTCIIWEMDPVNIPSCWTEINPGDLQTPGGTIYYGDPPDHMPKPSTYTISTDGNNTYLNPKFDPEDK